jgi:hypothetical protein
MHCVTDRSGKMFVPNEPNRHNPPEGMVARETSKHGYRCKCFLCIKRRPTFREKMVIK